MNAPDPAAAVFLNEATEKKLVCVKLSKIQDAAAFYVAKEDHTLGNLVRHALLRDPEVKFAGYRMMHPLVHTLEVKVQTQPGGDPLRAFVGALDSLQVEFETLENRFKDLTRRTADPDDAIMGRGFG